jgi:putative sterol carrier protein
MGYRSEMTATYADATQFEALFSRLFEEMADSAADLMSPLVESRMVIRFLVSKPSVEMWIDGRSAPVSTEFGPTDLEATLTAKLSGNNLHKLLLGTLPLGRALLFRKLKVDGSKSKAMKLEDLLHALQASYPDLAGEMLGTK